MALLLTFVAPTLASAVLPADGGLPNSVRTLGEKVVLLALAVLAGLTIARLLGRRELGLRVGTWGRFAVISIGAFVLLNVASAVWDRAMGS